jgi:hypothetical protein
MWVGLLDSTTTHDRAMCVGLLDSTTTHDRAMWVGLQDSNTTHNRASTASNPIEEVDPIRYQIVCVWLELAVVDITGPCCFGGGGQSLKYGGHSYSRVSR